MEPLLESKSAHALAGDGDGYGRMRVCGMEGLARRELRGQARFLFKVRAQLAVPATFTLNAAPVLDTGLFSLRGRDSWVRTALGPTDTSELCVPATRRHFFCRPATGDIFWR